MTCPNPCPCPYHRKKIAADRARRKGKPDRRKRDRAAYMREYRKRKRREKKEGRSDA